MSARAQGFFLSLVDQGLPCAGIRSSDRFFGLQMFGSVQPSSACISLHKRWEMQSWRSEELTVPNLPVGGDHHFELCPFNAEIISPGTPQFASLASNGATWTLNSPRLSVNGKTNSILTQSRNIIFDSGTSNVLFSTDTTEVWMAYVYSIIQTNVNSHRLCTLSYPQTLNRIPVNRGHTELLATGFHPFLQWLTSRSPPKVESHSIWPFLAASFQLGHLQMIHRLAKLLSMLSTAWNLLAAVYWSIGIASGILGITVLVSRRPSFEVDLFSDCAPIWIGSGSLGRNL